MNTNIDALFKHSIPFLKLFLITYFLSVIMFYILPKVGVEYVSNNSDFELSDNYHVFDNVKKTKRNPVLLVEKKEYKILSSLFLSAVYREDDGKGWIIIQEKKSLKTHILQKGDFFKNFSLKLLFPTYVIFEKEKKNYKLSIPNRKNKFAIMSEKGSKWDEEIFFDGEDIKIKRKIINSYINDIGKVWKNIEIKKLKKNGIISGYRIVKIEKKSLFYNLGLLPGDILTEINNTKLDNYQKVFKIYKNIKNISFLKIKILRENKEMELNYEIN